MNNVPMLELLVRILAAGLCGVVIGIEREFRAKEAGVRTHFLVSMGSALIMVVSIFGFADAGRNGDPGRLAAQIVSGIGFIGAGTIMVNRQNITGLTTAAGLWVTAGIGMAIGSGLYIVGVAGTLMVLIGLELLQLIFRKMRYSTSTVVFTTTRKSAINELETALKKRGWRLTAHNLVIKEKRSGEVYRVTMTLNEHTNLHNDDLLDFLHSFPDITTEKIE